MIWRIFLSGILPQCFLLLYTTPLFSQDVNTDSLKQVLRQQEGKQKVMTLNALASAVDQVGTDSAHHYALQAFQLAQEIDDDKSIIATEYALGTSYVLKKADTLALRHFTHALALAQSLGDPYLISAGYLKLSYYYLAVNDARRSVEYLTQCLEIAEAKKFVKHQTEAYYRAGAAYKALGAYLKSVDYYLKALRIHEELNESYDIAKACNSIATAYQRTGDYDHALVYLTRALKINEAANDAEATMINRLNIGVVYQKKKDYEQALAFFFKVLPVTRTLNDRLREAITTGNIGSTMISQGKLTEGLGYLNKALALKETLRNPQSILHTLVDIANVKVKLGDANGAKAAAERAVAMARQYGASQYLVDAYLALSNSYKLQQDYRNAHAFLEKYKVLNDSLFGIEKAQQISELQIQYDTEKKDLEINALNQEKNIATARRKIYFLVGTIVVLVLAALAINQRQKAKRNQALLEKEREVDRMKSDFFANISHEFRTPLSLILGPVETMLGKNDDPNDRFQLGLMKKNASRLLRLINQILELSKLQSGHLELKAAPLNAVDLARGVGASFQSLADEKGIQLAFEHAAEEIVVYSDQEQLETICINLISNAFKFTGSGGKITVRMRTTAPGPRHPQGAMEFQVIDTGVGIPPEHLAHIFDRFYRAGSAKQAEGTGIGLALTKELVELHGGTINVISELGVGTTVTVEVPLGQAHLQPDQVIEGESTTVAVQRASTAMPVGAVATEEIDMAEAHDVEKPIILLIEDNTDVRSYIRSILDAQYTLLEAGDGEAGIALAKAQVPDLIISDVMMPKMNGYEACKKLKQDETTSHIPVILLTAKASVDSRIEGLETEADLYLSKPFVPRELVLCIGNLIRSRKKLQERYNRQVVLKPTDIAINSVDELFLQRLMKVIEANHEDENFSVEQLSKEIGMSRSQLHRKLHALTNESTSQFIRSFRLQRAMELLRKNHASVSEIAYMVGFASPSYFNKCFQQHYGCTPSSVIEKNLEVRS